MSPAAQLMKMKAEKTWFFFLFNQRSKQEMKCVRAFQLGGGGEGGDTGDMFWQNFVTSQELMVACRNGPFLLLCSVCFSQFRAHDGTLENCSFQMSSVHVHARAYVCIIKEMSKGKFPDLGKQSIQAKKVYRLFFLACDTEMQKRIIHTQNEK